MKKLSVFKIFVMICLLAACDKGGQLDFKVSRNSTLNQTATAGKISAPILTSTTAHNFVSQTTAGEMIQTISEITVNGFSIQSTITAELIAP